MMILYNFCAVMIYMIRLEKHEATSKGNVAKVVKIFILPMEHDNYY